MIKFFKATNSDCHLLSCIALAHLGSTSLKIPAILYKPVLPFQSSCKIPIQQPNCNTPLPSIRARLKDSTPQASSLVCLLSTILQSSRTPSPDQQSHYSHKLLLSKHKIRAHINTACLDRIERIAQIFSFVLAMFDLGRLPSISYFRAYFMKFNATLGFYILNC